MVTNEKFTNMMKSIANISETRERNTKLKALRARQILRGQDSEPTWEGLFYQLTLTLSSAAVIGAGLGYLTLYLF